jgi:predicted hotdog family 3-hydroxylacyl-ACP dehydratase
MVPLDRARIAELIPHSGRMVLLHSVTAWDDTTITCHATSHRLPDNPLRRGRLSSLAGIEYAAQGMALHGALVSGNRRERRVLGSVREVRMTVATLDDIAADLTIRVQLLGQASAGAQYGFLVEADAKTLVTGRATVFAL